MRKPLYKRVWFWCLIIIAVFWAIGKRNELKEKAATVSPEASTPVQIAPTGSPKQDKSETVSYEITDTVFEYKTVSAGSTEYKAIVEILNTGTVDLYLDDCSFDLEDDNGHLLQTEKFISACPDVIRPGEKGYFYNGIGALLIDNNVPLENGVNLKPVPSVEKARGTIVEYEVSDVSLRAGMYGPTVTGRVLNNTDTDNSYFYIQVIYYGADGKVLAISGTSITDFKAGSQTSFEITPIGVPLGLPFDKIADYKIVARPEHLQF